MVREAELPEKVMAPPEDPLELKVHEVKDDVWDNGCCVVNESVYSSLEKSGEKHWTACFLTHSVKEELDEIKDIVVLSVRPEKRILEKVYIE